MNDFSLSFLSHFFGQPVTVDTPLGAFAGFLRKADGPQHSGIGNLLLETWESHLLLIKTWFSVKGGAERV